MSLPTRSSSRGAPGLPPTACTLAPPSHRASARYCHSPLCVPPGPPPWTMRPARHRRGLVGATALPPHAALSSIVRRTSILFLSPSPTATPSSPRQLARSATRRAISSLRRASVPSRLKVRSCPGLATHHTTHCRGWPFVPPDPATLLLPAVGGTGGVIFVLHNTHCSFRPLWNHAPPDS